MRKKLAFRNSEAMRLYGEGAAITEIVEALDMSYDRVLRLLKEKGVYRPEKRNNADKSKDSILEFMRMEDDATKAAAELQATEEHVKTLPKATVAEGGKYFYRNVGFDSYGEMKAYKKKTGVEVRLLDVEGKTRQEIAQCLGISLASVVRFLRD